MGAIENQHFLLEIAPLTSIATLFFQQAAPVSQAVQKQEKNISKEAEYINKQHNQL